MSERPLYEKTEALIEVLSGWTGRSHKFEDRFVEIFVDLYERDFLQVRDVEFAKKWIQDLKYLNYQFPKVISKSLSHSHSQFRFQSICDMSVHHAPTLNEFSHGRQKILFIIIFNSH